jgi:hypothetical protein
MNDFIFLKSFSSITEAELAKNILKSQDIISIIKNAGVKFPGDLGDSYGANLFVPKKDFEKAKEILEQRGGEQTEQIL